MVLWITLLISLVAKSIVVPGKQSVFGVYVAGVEHWYNNLSLYQKYPGIDYFRYAPSALFIFAPFVHLGYICGPITWGCFSVFALFFACKRMAGKFWPSDKLWAMGSIFCLLCALSGLWNHQSNALIGCLLVLGSLELFENNLSRSAFLFAIALVLKTTVLPVVFLIIVLKPYSMIIRVMIFASFFAFLPYLTKQPEVVNWQYSEWARHLLETSDRRWPGYRDFWFTILSVAEWFRSSQFNPGFWDCSPPFLYKILQMVSGLFCLFLCIQWKSLQPKDWYPRTLSLGLAWLMVFGPATELPTYGLIAPMFCWAFVEEFLKEKEIISKYNKEILIASFLLVLVISLREFTIYIAHYFPPILSAAPIGIVLFSIWLIRDSQQKLNNQK